MQVLEGLVESLKIDLRVKGRVVFGRDTRPSGVGLNEALKEGLRAMGLEEGEIEEGDGEKGGDVGVVTTPVLHYLVRSLNTVGKGGVEEYGVPTKEGYYHKMASAFRKLTVSKGLSYLYSGGARWQSGRETKMGGRREGNERELRPTVPSSLFSSLTFAFVRSFLRSIYPGKQISHHHSHLCRLRQRSRSRRSRSLHSPSHLLLLLLLQRSPRHPHPRLHRHHNPIPPQLQLRSRLRQNKPKTSSHPSPPFLLRSRSWKTRLLVRRRRR